MRRPTIALYLLVFTLLLPGCPRKGPAERARVAVSIFPVYDLVRRIAGPDADVSLVVPPGRTEHGYEPTPKDVEEVGKAKLVVMVGPGLDPWMERLAGANARIVKVADRVPPLTAAGDDDHDKDPHVWLDPERARLIVRAVAEELGRADAAHALAYRERSTEIDKALTTLDKEVEDRTKALPSKSLVTFHGAFAFFAERYKLSVVGVVEPVPGKEPSPDASKKLVETIKAKKVAALFSEPQLDARPVKAIADEAKIPLGVLDPLGGAPETDSYEKLIRFDVVQLEKTK